MDDSTQIKYEKVAEAVKNIHYNKTVLQDILNDFTIEMENATSDNVLQGEASEELKMKFADLKSKFDNYISMVNDFESMITMAKDSVASTEKAIADAAKNLFS